MENTQKVVADSVITEEGEEIHMNDDIKKLTRSKNRVICGVCGGVGEYFGIDPTIIRLLFVFFGFTGGAGILAYFIAAAIIPNEE